MEKFLFEFYRWEQEIAQAPFLLQPFGDRWETWTWQEAGIMARKMANGLLALGLPPKSHIGLVSKNCREWLVADLAIIMAGYVSVPFFPTLTGPQINQVLGLGDVKALFVGKIENWEDMQQGIPTDMPVIAFPHYDKHAIINRGQQWQDILDEQPPLEEVAELLLDDVWTIIYTSGTTGVPKGVVLDYRIFDAAKISTETTNPLRIDLGGNNRFFSYLPLNHIAERVVVEGALFRYGGMVAFSESLATFAKNLADIQPTVFFGVPRIYSKFQQGILSKMPQAKIDKLLRIPILSGLIKKKIRQGLGLHEARVWVSGAAPLPESTKVWYNKLDINITNGYAMTENCAICTILEPNANKSGAVGKPQTGVELKIDAETGEILMKGPFVMRAYYKEPEKTAEVLRDGWLHTGDQGYIDNEGDLCITGRVADTFKTAKGKFIVPAPIEASFITNTDVEQICLLGLGCDQPMMMVNLSPVGVAKSRTEIVESLETTRKTLNKDLPNYQRIDKIIIAQDAWTVENGLVTPTLKVKRNAVNNKYQDALLHWQEAADSIIFETQEK